MTLDQKQQAEKTKLKQLLSGLDANPKNWASLNKVVSAYFGMGYDDPTEHFVEALRHYVNDV